MPLTQIHIPYYQWCVRPSIITHAVDQSQPGTTTSFATLCPLENQVGADSMSQDYRLGMTNCNIDTHEFGAPVHMHNSTSGRTCVMIDVPNKPPYLEIAV